MHFAMFNIFNSFWVTVCIICLYVLSLMLVYCGQTVGWIKMARCMEVGLAPVHIVLDGDTASDHIVAQQANRYIVAFHIAISYDTQRPPYNGRAVGIPPTRCMYGLI